MPRSFLIVDDDERIRRSLSDALDGPTASVTAAASAEEALEVLAVSPSSTLVSAQIQKGTRATNTTDLVSGDGAPSPTATIDGGAGIYDVFVDKTDAGVETYELDLRCMTGAGGTGAETGTAISGSESVPAMPLAAWLALGGALALAARRWRS